MWSRDHQGMAESLSPHGAQELVTWLIAQAGGDPKKVAEGAEVNVSTIRKWARGQFPNTRRSGAILAVHAWAVRTFNGEYPPAGFPRGGLPALVDQPARDETTPSRNTTTSRRRPRLLVLVALLGIIVLMLGADFTTAQSAGRRPDFDDLHVGEPPSPGELAPPVVCRLMKTREIDLPGAYRGHVFVQLIARDETPVHLQLVYGPHILDLDVIVYPGVADRYLGGTLIQFRKDDTTIEKPAMVNPSVTIRLNHPLCILTGTAADHVMPRPVLFVQPHDSEWTTPPANSSVSSPKPTN